jgi:hypothetical protein
VKEILELSNIKGGGRKGYVGLNPAIVGAMTGTYFSKLQHFSRE